MINVTRTHSDTIMPRHTEKQDQIIAFLRQNLPDVKLIYLFGSRASGHATENSDWDLAVLNTHPIDNKQRWDLAQELASLLNSDIDLVDLIGASTVLQMQVVSQGQRLFGVVQDTDVFETQVYSMYAHLQESRREIINEFVDDLKNG